MKKLISKITSSVVCAGILLSSQTAAYAETISVDPDYPIHGNKCGIIYVKPDVDRDVYVKITQFTPDGDYVYYNTVIPAAGSAVGENDYSFVVEGKDDVSYDIEFGVPKFKTSGNPKICTYGFTIKDTDDIVDDVISGYSFYFDITGNDKIEKPEIVSTDNPPKGEDNIILTNTEIAFPLADYIRGDVNFDGQISLLDAIEIAKHILDNSYLSGDRFLAADYNEDGDVSLMDAIGIAGYILENMPT